MASNRRSNPRRRAHDPITSLPYQAGVQTIVIATHEHLAPPDYLQREPTPVAAPLVLHRSIRGGGSSGVGLDFTRGMDAYLASGDSPMQKRMQVAIDRAWWLSPYGVRLVRQRLAEWYPSVFADKMLQDVLGCIMGSVPHTRALNRAITDCERLSRSHKRGCQCANCLRNNYRPSYYSEMIQDS